MLRDRLYSVIFHSGITILMPPPYHYWSGMAERAWEHDTGVFKTCQAHKNALCVLYINPLEM